MPFLPTPPKRWEDVFPILSFRGKGEIAVRGEIGVTNQTTADTRLVSSGHTHDHTQEVVESGE